MILNKLKFILPLAAGFVLGLIFYDSFLKTHSVEYKEVEVEVETEVEIEKIDTVFIPDIQKIPYQAEESPEPEKYDSLRTYKGFELIPFGSISWQATTGGYLKDIRFNPKLDIPVVTNTITRRETVVRNLEKPSLYLTASYQTGLKNLSPGVVYTNKNLLAGYRYNFSIENHEFTLGWRIK